MKTIMSETLLSAALRAAQADDLGEAQPANMIPVRQLTASEHVDLAKRIANRAAIDLIEDASVKIAGPANLYDLLPMLDARVWDPYNLNQHVEAITLAFDAGLIKSDPTQTHLVRIVAPTGL